MGRLLPFFVIRAALLGSRTAAFADPLPADSLAPSGKWTANAHGRALTPPMGWNSYNAYGVEIDEAKVLSAAQGLVDTSQGAV